MSKSEDIFKLLASSVIKRKSPITPVEARSNYESSKWKYDTHVVRAKGVLLFVGTFVLAVFMLSVLFAYIPSCPISNYIDKEGIKEIVNLFLDKERYHYTVLLIMALFLGKAAKNVAALYISKNNQ